MPPRPGGCRPGPRGSAGRTRRGCARVSRSRGGSAHGRDPGAAEGRGSGVDVGMRGPVRVQAQEWHRPSAPGWAGQGRAGQGAERSPHCPAPLLAEWRERPGSPGGRRLLVPRLWRGEGPQLEGAAPDRVCPCAPVLSQDPSPLPSLLPP